MNSCMVSKQMIIIIIHHHHHYHQNVLIDMCIICFLFFCCFLFLICKFLLVYFFSQNIGWSFSFNQNIPVWNLTDNKRNLIMYTSSHTGIIYDYQNNTQSILQGHVSKTSKTFLFSKNFFLLQ